MTAMVLWMNVPLMAVAFGLCTGLPLWMVFRHPDEAPARRLRAYVSGQRAVPIPAPRAPAAGAPATRAPAQEAPAQEAPAQEAPAQQTTAEQQVTDAPRAGAPAVPRQPGSSEQRSVDA